MKPIVLVGGRVASRPFNGGSPWVRLSWVLGLRRLGFASYLVDQIDSRDCVDEHGQVVRLEDSVNLAYFQYVVDAFGLQGTAALIYADGQQVYGMSRSELLDLAGSAELMINVSGAVSWPTLLRRPGRSAFIDPDPGFTQFACTQGTLAIGKYDFHFTYGENIGQPGCPIPSGGLRWRPVRVPVVLSEWPVVSGGDPSRFTTVAAWRAQARGPLEHAGRTFGLKADELRAFLELPKRSPHMFEIALRTRASRGFLAREGGDAEVEAEREDMRRLELHGWRIVDPREVVPDPFAYRNYIQASGAEFSVAKGIYVDTNSGWFSDRTICYLASGKPALVQETGFSRNIPVGEGLLSYRTLDEAVAGADEIHRNYDRHSRAARAIAEEYFGSDRVIGDLLREVGVFA